MGEYVCHLEGAGSVRSMDYTVKKLNQEELGYLYKTYMVPDFPPGELKPLSHIIRSMEKGFGFTLGFYAGENLIGYAVFIVCKEMGCALLDYFAIVKERRGQGAGHEAFELLLRYFEERMPEINGIYIEAEQVARAKNEKEQVIRERRIAFYQSCDCMMTRLESKLFGVEYSILYRQLGEKMVPPTWEAVDAIYRVMFKKEHYEQFVTLVMK